MRRLKPSCREGAMMDCGAVDDYFVKKKAKNMQKNERAERRAVNGNKRDDI